MPASAQPRDTITAKTADPNETVIKYEEFLRKEAEAHRQYTQENLSLIIKSLGVLVGLIVTVVGLVGWKSISDMKKSMADIENLVNKKFEDTVQDTLNKKLAVVNNKIAEFESIIDKNSIQAENSIKDFNRKLNENRVKIEENNDYLQRVEANTLKTIGKPFEKQENGSSKLAGKKVLWVDDVPANNENIKLYLEKQGMQFELALDTGDAIDLLKKKKYDLVISDIGRPSSDEAGLDLLKSMKGTAAMKEIRDINPETPVIIFCGPGGANRYRREAINLGAKDVTAIVSDLYKNVNELFPANSAAT